MDGLSDTNRCQTKDEKDSMQHGRKSKLPARRVRNKIAVANTCAAVTNVLGT